MSKLGTITRRTLLVGAVAVAGGVAFGYYRYRKPYPNPLKGKAAEGEAVFNAYVTIRHDETITVIVPRAEMGQGVTTTLAALVAEELDIGLDAVNVAHGPASYAYYNRTMLEEGGPFAFFDDSLLAETTRGVTGAVGKFLGLQGTGGSTSTRDAFEKMRLAGAAARETLKRAAAERLDVDVRDLTTENGTVRGPSGETLTYGALAEAAAAVEPPSVTLRDPAKWRLIGKSQPRTDILEKVTGAPVFAMDVTLPDMLFATVKMSPRFGARPANTELAEAEAMPGVKKIVPIETLYGHGFGIIADNSWNAFRAADAIKTDWRAEGPPLDDAAISEALDAALDRRDGYSLRDDGDADGAFADAPRERILEADYSVPYLAHATMEPMNATALFNEDSLEIWAGNQMPTLTRQLCADAAGIAEDAVTVHTPMMGGGFGRRAEVDFALYAVLIAKSVAGRPVKVTWSREEDIRHDVYRPAAKGRFRARLGDDGLPVAVDMHIAAPSIIRSAMRRTFPSLSPAGPDRLITEGAFDQPYTITDYRVTGSEADLKIPIGFWRSVGNSCNAFFHECFMDEIANAGGIDPVEMRLALMRDYPAAVKVVEKVAKIAGWGTAEKGRAKGFAFTLSFGAWTGQIVEIAETPQGIKVENVWCAADLGTVLDPDIVKAQMMSGIIFGLSSAISQEINFRDGAVVQSNFHDYDAMRMNQSPNISVELLENADKIGGAGEPGTPPSIPALANAVFALTGQRFRDLPLNKHIAFV